LGVRLYAIEPAPRWGNQSKIGEMAFKPREHAGMQIQFQQKDVKAASTTTTPTFSFDLPTFLNLMMTFMLVIIIFQMMAQMMRNITGAFGGAGGAGGAAV
jgi:hypothetical protein